MKTFVFVYNIDTPLVVVIKAANKNSAIKKLAAKMYAWKPRHYSPSPEAYKDDLATGDWMEASLVV